MNYIFNADDFGRTETVNLAITEGFKLGKLDRTTIMVNMPYYDEALKLAKEYHFFDKVGLHINLTSGEPLTEKIKSCSCFCDQDGKFTGEIFNNRKWQFFLPKNVKLAIEEEINAQIDKYEIAGFHLYHADSHGHVHTFPSILPSVLRCLKKHRFKSLRIAANLHGTKGKKIYKVILNNVINSYNKRNAVACNYFDSFKSVIRYRQRLENRSGICEVMLHPNIWDGDIQIGEGLHFSDI